MIEKVVETIENRHGGVVISPSMRAFAPLPRDIDIFVPDTKRSQVAAYLQGEGFACIDQGDVFQARKFIGGKCFFLDLAFNRAIFDKKKSFWGGILKGMGKGKIIAIVGPDGSGKTTVTEALTSALFGSKMYMGDYALLFQKVYNQLYKLPVILARFTHLFIYIENWFRYAKAFFLSRVRGKMVLVDRYPGLNRNLARNNFWLKVNDFIYRFFPDADRYLFISASPEKIHERTPQLTVEEIARSQENIRARLSKKKGFVEIENTDLDTCLNLALKNLLS